MRPIGCHFYQQRADSVAKKGSKQKGTVIYLPSCGLQTFAVLHFAVLRFCGLIIKFENF